MNGDRCLFCRKLREEPLHFRTLLSPETPPGLCRSCAGKLAPIDPRRSCERCGRDLGRLDGRLVHGNICRDCERWAGSGRNGLFGKNRSLYSYNEMMKEIITAFKFRSDAVMAQAFRKEFRTAYRRLIRDDPSLWIRIRKGGRLFRNDPSHVIIPIPLSEERLQQRGFNQAVLLTENLGRPITEALIRRSGEEKQSKKNRRQRLKIPRNNPFTLDPQTASSIAGKKVILVDDIYTTGATLRLAAAAIEPAAPLSIDSLTLVHG
ncbi:ComF family protein [Sporolactobacillus sp. THM7-4]|nr:ComF family protein [Sporolactobacillus sp. THM7-4]